MQRVRLGHSGIEAGRLGLGTVELGMAYGLLDGAPPPAEDEAVRLLHRALDLGIDYFDTAAAYGRSEEILGRAFAGLAARPTVATKVALPASEHADLRAHLRSSVEQSLRRLRVQTLDLVQIHNLEKADLRPQLMAGMEEVARAGLVRFWGATTYGEEAPLAALERREIAVLQVAYNALDRRLEKAVFPRCRAADVGLVLRSVFLQGVLSARLADLPVHLEPLGRAARRLQAIAAEAGLSLAELALRFAAYAGGDLVLCGTARRAEMEANIRAFAAGPLPADVAAAIRRVNIEDETLLNPGTWKP